MRQAQKFLARRDEQSPEWRAVTGFDDTLVYVTADELAELVAQREALAAAFHERNADPSKRPPGARAIGLIQLAIPAPTAPDRPAR